MAAEIKSESMKILDLLGQGETCIDRKYFGPGQSGERAYAYLSSKPVCEECGEVEAELILGFDIPGLAGGATEDTHAFCLRCYPKARQKIDDELQAMGKYDNTFTINGWGRS